jgi:hypothetical protein
MILRTRRGASLCWLAAFALAAAAYGARPSARDAGAESPPGAQELFNLERRISVVEQRLNSVELAVNRIEQQSRLQTPAPSSSAALRDTELELLRSEVELLQRRVAEDECGLVRLDERTLAPQAREARRRDARSAADRDDPCRLSADAPLRLSARQ